MARFMDSFRPTTRLPGYIWFPYINYIGFSNIIYIVFYIYRGFKRNGGRVLVYNIIVVPHLRYGLKRCSGTFGSISDLNEAVVR
jgi:hypothetical protein